MKQYTDIEQSRKLANILDLDTADMHYNNISARGVNYTDPFRCELMPYLTAKNVLRYDIQSIINPMIEVIPCWSLAKLIDILPIYLEPTHDNVRMRLMIDKAESGYEIWYESCIRGFASEELNVEESDFVDACTNMILKLKERNLI